SSSPSDGARRRPLAIRALMPVIFAWSGGKDSALALAEVLSSGRDQVVGLLTTVTAGHDRISMHGVRRTLLHQQAEALGLPLREVLISPQSSNEEYEAKMGAALADLTAAAPAVDGVVFGDLFLQDVRAYRERMLARVGMRGLVPLAHRDTAGLARGFVGLQDRAVRACAGC